MAVQPTGRSILTMYRQYRDGQLLVNRRYQRKLVWTLPEKKRLIESILNDYPIPQFILARITRSSPRHDVSFPDEVFEIIDGVQRLNAIFGFIENQFSINDKYFDVQYMPRARQAADDGEISFYPKDSQKLLDQSQCGLISDYQLAVTSFDADDERRVTAIFGCINTGGRQLSEQDRRQAGATSRFNDLVRRISALIRGDETQNPVDLRYMPSISVDLPFEGVGYAVKADEVFWCRHGIVRHAELRNSLDEQVVADLLASVAIKEPIKNDRSDLDELYKDGSDVSLKVENALKPLSDHEAVKRFLYIIGQIETVVNHHPRFDNFRAIVHHGRTSNPMRSTFHAVFCSFYELIFERNIVPADYKGIAEALDDVHESLQTARGSISVKKRGSNVKKITGLIQEFFVPSREDVGDEQSILSVAYFTNYLIRAASETSRFELKQGIKEVTPEQRFNNNLLSFIPKILCGIANSNPAAGGMLILGVADNASDAERIKRLFSIEEPKKIGNFFVVGVDHETKGDVDAYLAKIIGVIRDCDMSSQLKQSVTTNLEPILWDGRTIVRISVPPQEDVSFVDSEVWLREGSATKRADTKSALEIQKEFQRLAR